MAEEKSVGGGSLLGNPSALLALVTVVGGLWLVSQKLTSDRPVTPAGESKEFIGDQKLEVRLWEDPFRPLNGATANDPTDDVSGLSVLAEQIRRRSTSKVIDPSGNGRVKRVVLLPAMISGGQYSEDQESRIRSRFAIVSALGRAGYAPEDAEHIGNLKIPWPTQEQLARAKQTPAEGAPRFAELWSPAKNSGEKARFLGVEIPADPAHMVIRYEWYRPRVFSASSGNQDDRPAILLLWLDDSFFEDNPLIRLPLLLEPLTDVHLLPAGTPEPRVALIGPRRSSTLRGMLPSWQTDVQPLAQFANQDLATLAKKVINRIEIFCATPSAMDEVLVKHPQTPDRNPRASIREKLLKEGFKSFHNFAATDAQMAREIFGELALRGVDLKDDEEHVVLISEWDTFYARMLSLTYAAELSAWQENNLKTTDSSPARFIDAYVAGSETNPKNFHPFVYLRGLDGQTIGGDAVHESGDGGLGPASVDELRRWVPDVNKAEGPAQFDYLGRIGDRMDELQKSLKREGRGRISAIGIVGSDVYDKLLILQALRDRFPSAFFFTTDLDVRYLHPREREWARNLVVASAYGLALNDKLQGNVPQFRDSAQTAQFAATLAALGADRYLPDVERIPVRRFEIGNRTATDLSVQSSELVTNQSGVSRQWLHPLTASERDRWAPADHDLHPLWWSLVIAGLLAAGVSWVWTPLRRMTWSALAYPREALDFAEEDVGGPDGVETLMQNLDSLADDTIARWLISQPHLQIARAELNLHPLKNHGELEWEREKILTRITALTVKALNQLLRQNRLADGFGPPALPLPPQNHPGFLRRIVQLWPHARELAQTHDRREYLNAYLDRVGSPGLVLERGRSDSVPAFEEHPGSLRRQLKTVRTRANRFLDTISGDEAFPRCRAEEQGPEAFEQTALHAAIAARGSAVRIFRLRCRQLGCFWAGAILLGAVGIVMIVTIWNNTFKSAEGEPFSLVSGTSAWPAEVFRLLIFVLAVCFCLGLSHRLREAFLTLTRSFHFSLPSRRRDDSAWRLSVQSIWYDYRENSRFRRRFLRVMLFVPIYLLLLVAINQALGESMTSPVRGPVLHRLNSILLGLSLLGFLLLAFFTVDAARLCREFIEKLSTGPTRYPSTTRRHFSRLKGGIDAEYLDEWIDLQLIAELTEQVGRLVYFPSCLLLLMILARNRWWDHWAWPVSLIVVFACNFILALASVVILQTAARAAKRRAEASLAAKIKKLQAQAAPSLAQNNATQAENLLDEIQHLDRGAFVPFWDNPVVGALFLSSGGTTALQVFIWFMGR
ncbi:MAG TPA: hypothetical protein VGM64_20340 [Lacunisphaera sp.]|jgi:hypothetical protein